jgi:hypothetical protein
MQIYKKELWQYSCKYVVQNEKKIEVERGFAAAASCKFFQLFDVTFYSK